MKRVLTLTSFLLTDFSRSIWVVLPPGLLFALYRVFFQYGSDVPYFGAVGAIMLGSICVLTTLLLIRSADRASSYALLARIPQRGEMLAAISAASLAITLALSILFVIIIVFSHAVPLTASALLSVSARWLVLFLYLIAFSLHLSKLVSRGGSHLVAYALLLLSLVSYERVEYPALPLLDWAENVVSFVLQPLTATIGGAGLNALPVYALMLLLTLLYALLLYALAEWLFRRKDLLWAE